MTGALPTSLTFVGSRIHYQFELVAGTHQEEFSVEISVDGEVMHPGPSSLIEEPVVEQLEVSGSVDTRGNGWWKHTDSYQQRWDKKRRVYKGS